MLVFIHINKTAGRTVRYILRSSYGMRHCEAEPWAAEYGAAPFTADDLRRVRKIYPRLASIAGHRVTGYADLEAGAGDLRYFTFLRDPVRLTASRFQYHVDHRGKRGLRFEEWLWQDWLRNPQTRQIGGTERPEDAIRIIEEKDVFVGLTERFDESLVLLKALRAPDLDIRYAPVNVAKRSTIAADLLADPRTRETIAEANAADVALYKHATTVLFPAAARTYGPSLEAAATALRSDGSADFDQLRLAASRVMQYGVYKPVVRLYRDDRTHAMVGRLLG